MYFFFHWDIFSSPTNILSRHSIPSPRLSGYPAVLPPHLTPSLPLPPSPSLSLCLLPPCPFFFCVLQQCITKIAAAEHIKKDLCQEIGKSIDDASDRLDQEKTDFISGAYVRRDERLQNREPSPEPEEPDSLFYRIQHQYGEPSQGGPSRDSPIPHRQRVMKRKDKDNKQKQKQRKKKRTKQ